MKTQHAFYSERGALRAAFTLVEIVVVLAIITIIMAFSTPYAFSVIQSASVTSVGDTLMQKISQAQQTAMTENRVTALQFYVYEKDAVTACHAMQLMSVDPATNEAKPIEEPIFFADGRVVIAQGMLSPLFNYTLPADTGAANAEPFKSLTATFYRVRFYPNGGTSLSIPLRQAYFTLMPANAYKSGMEEAPKNYYSIQIDPVVGRPRSYRP